MSTPELSKKEQRILARAKDKIKTINEDMLNSKGLTEAEANVAAKAGLIDPEQKYWWLESWQKGEREAERDEREGRSSSEFETTEDLLAHLFLKIGKARWTLSNRWALEK